MGKLKTRCTLGELVFADFADFGWKWEFGLTKTSRWLDPLKWILTKNFYFMERKNSLFKFSDIEIFIFLLLMSTCFIFSNILFYLKIVFYENIFSKIFNNALNCKDKNHVYLISKNILLRTAFKIDLWQLFLCK